MTRLTRCRGRPRRRAGRAPPPPPAPSGRRTRGFFAATRGAAPTVLPAAWRRDAAEGTFEAALPRRLFDLADGGSGPTALTVDRASAWRASEMAGVLLQGRAEAYAVRELARGRRSARERVD